eukprot:414564_1
MAMYHALLHAFSDYSMEYIQMNHVGLMGYDDDYSLQYVSRFVGKNVCDFLLPNDSEDGSKRFKWKLTCLREANDGKMSLNPVRSDIIGARIDGLKGNIDGMQKFDIDAIIGFCDLCRLEISDYGWRYNCNQHI